MKKILTLVCLVLVFGSCAWGAVPQKISVQGKIIGPAIEDGQQNASITLTKTFGVAPRSQIYSGVPVMFKNNVFNATLTLSPVFVFDNLTNLSLTVNGVIYPVIDFTSVPYALNSDKLDGLSVTSFATKDANGNIVGLDLTSFVTKDASGNLVGDFPYVKKSGDSMEGSLEVTKSMFGSDPIPNSAIKGSIPQNAYATGHLGYVDSGYKYYGVFGKTDNSIGNNTIGVYGLGGTLGVFGKGKSGGSFEATASNGYSGFFHGGSGVKIVGPLEVTGSISLPAQAIKGFVKDTGDTMTGALTISQSSYAWPILILVNTNETFGVQGSRTPNSPTNPNGYLPFGVLTSASNGLVGGSFYSKKNYGLYSLADGDYAAVAGESGGKYSTIVGFGTGVLGKADAGVGVSGLSNSGFGVVGKSTSGNRGGVSGIYGDINTYSGISDTKYGVAGVSDQGTGVYGNSTIGAAIKGERGITVGELATLRSWGGSNKQMGVFGNSPEIAIYGSATGTGVNSSSIGVAGYSSSTGTGVWGQSANGVGVLGKGSTAGGSFESANGVGVHGSGNVAGGSFESESGIGVYGKSQKYNQAGVFATNTTMPSWNSFGGGPALSIGDGYIKMPIQSYTIKPSTYLTPLGGFLAGSIKNETSAGWFTVPNSFVKESSIIIVTQQDGAGPYGPSQSVCVRNKINGKFDIWIPASSTVGYFVIN